MPYIRAPQARHRNSLVQPSPSAFLPYLSDSQTVERNALSVRASTVKTSHLLSGPPEAQGRLRPLLLGVELGALEWREAPTCTTAETTGKGSNATYPGPQVLPIGIHRARGGRHSLIAHRTCTCRRPRG